MFERFQKDRALDRARQTTQRILSAQGEINAQSMAVKLIEHYQLLNADQRLAFFDFLATHFNPDPAQVQAAAAAYAAEPSASHLVHLCQVVEPQRQELLRRINRAPQGTAALVKMRQTLLSHLATQPALAVIDADMHHLLSSWFNPGFLELHQITWRSSAQLLESLIHHESVHAIDGWDDLRRRLQPDRRCYAFFHRQLPDEPLIFVEVALVPELATNVGRLIDKTAPIAEASTFKTAVFYSISNCQPGLKGVSLGNFLIKRVVQKLLDEWPTLKLFATLSPIPGFTRWLDRGALLPDGALSERQQRQWATATHALHIGSKPWAERLAAGWQPQHCDPAEQEALMRLCSLYLLHHTLTPQGDAVATFHLSNGATLHQLNWAADISAKGLRQSAGLMVNYVYELEKVEQQHEAFVKGRIAHSRQMLR